MRSEDREVTQGDFAGLGEREGVRVVIELKRGEIPLVVLNNLYKHTQLETTFGVIMLALVNNPRTPVGVSLGLGLHALSDREMTDLSKNRNIPGAVSRAAQQLIDRRKGADSSSGGGKH